MLENEAQAGAAYGLAPGFDAEIDAGRGPSSPQLQITEPEVVGEADQDLLACRGARRRPDRDTRSQEKANESPDPVHQLMVSAGCLEGRGTHVACGRANIGSVSTRTIPESLGPYELLAEIGRGPTAVVYRAWDPARDRTVAIRVPELPPGLSDAARSTVEENTLELARLASRLSHPRITALHEAGRDSPTGIVFLVFDQVEGQTLAERLEAEPPLGWREGLTLVRNVADALQHAHAGGVIHGNVRPANILLLASGESTLLDVGVRRLSSPEQSVDVQTDLFSLGCVAYRLLTGRDAFEGRNPAAVPSAPGDPPRPTLVVPDLPPGVDQAIARALAPSSRERYPDARAFVEDLDEILTGRWPRHSPAGEPATTRRFSFEPSESSGAARVLSSEATAHGRARRAGRALAGVVAMVLVLGIEAWRRVTDSPAPPPSTTPPAPVSSPTPLASGVPTPFADPGLPSLDEPPPAPATATLRFELDHTLKSGRALVFVDGAKVLDERLAATGGKSVLGLRVRSGRLGRALDVPPGRREVRVQLMWEDGGRSETIIVDVKAGATRRLAARLGRLKKNLSLELR